VRIRSIKPEFWAHPILGRLPDRTQLLALALLSMADDHGYFHADPAIVRGSVAPFRESLASVSEDLARLSKSEWIDLWDHPQQGAMGKIKKWSDHQKIDHPSKSKLAAYDIREELATASRESRDELALDQGSGIRDQGRDQGRDPPPSPPPPLVHVGTDFLASDTELAAASVAPLPPLPLKPVPKGFRDWRMLHPVFMARTGEDGDSSAWESLWRDCEPAAWAIFQAMATACQPDAGKRLYFNVACEWINRACPHQEEAQG